MQVWQYGWQARNSRAERCHRHEAPAIGRLGFLRQPSICRPIFQARLHVCAGVGRPSGMWGGRQGELCLQMMGPHPFTLLFTLASWLGSFADARCVGEGLRGCRAPGLSARCGAADVQLLPGQGEFATTP